MKVVFLCYSLHVGGTERQISVLAKGLQHLGHEIVVVVFHAGGALERDLIECGIRIIDLKKNDRWDILFFFRRVVNEISLLTPDIIYSFLSTPNILAVLLKPFFMGTKMVLGVRSSKVNLDLYDWLYGLAYRVECFLARFADIIICNSSAGIEYAADHGFPQKLMTVIPNGIDLNVFRPDLGARQRLRDEWGISNEEVLIGLVARLDPMKDHPTFLHAAAMLAQERGNVRFVCVGDGSNPYKSQLASLASSLNLDNRLKWINSRLDMPSVYNAFDIACSSSIGEGFSNTIIEAMACGVPCVVTDVGDSALIVRGTGVVVPYSSPLEFCAAFELLLNQISPELAIASRRSIKERYSNERLVAKTMDVLLKALCKP
jgi:glycosyltransferase involved in cell wall biosynthesis